RPHFLTSGEAQRLRDVHGGLAEKRILPHPQGKGADWHWNRNVDSNHADFNVELELARCVAIASENSCAITKSIVIYELNGFVVVFNANYSQHGAKRSEERRVGKNRRETERQE